MDPQCPQNKRKCQFDKYLFFLARLLVRGVNPMGATEKSGHHLIIRPTEDTLDKYNMFTHLGSLRNNPIKPLALLSF